MLYILAVIFPPLAVLMCGRPFNAVISLGLTLLFWVPGVVHAFLIVLEYKADKRMLKQVELMKK